MAIKLTRKRIIIGAISVVTALTVAIVVAANSASPSLDPISEASPVARPGAAAVLPAVPSPTSTPQVALPETGPTFAPFVHDADGEQRSAVALAVVSYSASADYRVSPDVILGLLDGFVTDKARAQVKAALDENDWAAMTAGQDYRYVEVLRQDDVTANTTGLAETDVALRLPVVNWESKNGGNPINQGLGAWNVILSHASGTWIATEVTREY